MPKRTHRKRTRLLTARESVGLTLRQVTAFTGIAPSRLSEYERALSEPTVSTAIRIARLYGRSVEDLFAEFV
jgi:transcriptional regulator with XRE-family HTH domain